jgi:multidrug efflux pump subunit AcrB
VDFPTIQVTTQLPGANPDTIAEESTEHHRDAEQGSRDRPVNEWR